MREHKTAIYLAADSTVQSYPAEFAPQAGWGEMLIRYFADRDYRVRTAVTEPFSAFGNAVRYESAALVIDNRAMGARSTKTFTEEGRLADVLASIRAGDWLLMQFGHNDANADKPERYVTPAEFAERLLRDFITPAREKEVHPVLVTPLALKEFDENGACRISFPAYREAMLTLGEREKVPVIDLGKLSAEYNTRIGEEACKALYLWLPAGVFPHWAEGSEDFAHLQTNGAFLYAGLVAGELEKLEGFPARRRREAAIAPKTGQT